MASTKTITLTYREKVPVLTMKEIILASLQERLTGAQYEGEKCNEAAKVLADTIRSRLKNLGFQRYKFVVQVVIGERREQGIRLVESEGVVEKGCTYLSNIGPRWSIMWTHMKETSTHRFYGDRKQRQIIVGVSRLAGHYDDATATIELHT
jgi:hypothetical protein